ncbi:hypothetical protein [Cohnella boryungensis]|uniref:Uncharacterized protein n=1 Tax=Cohnella boryungensis TaxID=768479 RepID=A0ABV8SDU0_9BACL
MQEIRKRIFILLLAASLVFPMLSKPALAEEQVIINEMPDPDLADVQAAKEAVENADYPAANQEEHGTEAAAKSYVEERVKQAVNNDAIDLSIHVDAYTAPKAGDADFPDGTDGQVAFTVTLTKGAQVQSAARQTLGIKATPYSGVSNREILNRAMSRLAGEHPTMDVPLGTTLTELNVMVKSYFNDLLRDIDLDYLSISLKPADIEGQLTVEVYIEKGNYTWDETVVNLPINEEHLTRTWLRSRPR